MDLFSYSLFLEGFLSAFFIALSTSLIGFFLLIKRLAMLGAGLSHAAFGGIAIALLLDVDPIAFTVLYTVLLGLFIQFLVDKKSLPADTVVALFFSLGVALAIIILGMTENLGANVFSYLFGSMLTASTLDLLLSFLIFLLTITFILFNYRSLLLLSFNEELSKLRGVRVELLNYLLISIASANVVLSIKAVGLVLSASFISIPAMTSLMVSTSFLQSLMLSAIFSFLSLFFGIALALVADLPPSGAVVACMVFMFLLVAFGRFMFKFLRIEKSG
ncbi:MAG: metal ABC transporter permease [Aquificaceae bacterium]|nr:metal ABC transporter permease [Aquificaceae bacterium]MDW8423715.1 metal ABC transporter permease [Aquificaceae bacterium]